MTETQGASRRLKENITYVDAIGSRIRRRQLARLKLVQTPVHFLAVNIRAASSLLILVQILYFSLDQYIEQCV